MRKAAFSFILLALAALASPAGAHPGPPVVVELFTAQGCSSCGDANALVGELAEREDVLPLTFSVDYWDYLGWPDTFALPEFTERQQAYAKRLGPREVYTPQVVVDGRTQASGAKPETVEELVEEAAQASRNPPDMLYQLNGKIAVGSGPRPRGGAEVWLVRYDPAEVEVEVRKGDNRGETIKARNVVRQLVRLGGWRGRPNAYRLPAAEQEGLETLVIVQQTGGGEIIA
ncbi:MAG TPA: DUF1223 domain-containing protein, partial [Caulobacteraceae bacterium]|nr:DUF1223 domain-containing protein [Caulobacteraceae bacterium]